MPLSRRTVVKCLAGALAAPAAVVAETLQPTPQETFGPFFPVRTPADHDFDLTRGILPGGKPKGQVMELSGHVMRTNGARLPNAIIEIWQANAAGRYINPVDKNPAPLDPNFKGVAVLRSNADGAFRIRTIKPGPYPDPAGGLRTPHIHFDVTAGDYRLVTQMYFPDEPLNEKDLLLSTMKSRYRNPALAICKAMESSQAGILAFRWDIVMLQA